MSATCRSCDQPIVWVVTEATETKPARAMPLDADPERPTKALKVEDGNLIFTGQRDGRGSWIVRYVGKGKDRYRSHFATCPQRDQHRKAQRR